MGIICAALGIDRNDDEALGKLSELRMTTYILCPEEERLIDYQTVGGGYDELHQGFVCITAEGKSGSTVVTHREYLSGARFAVIVEGNFELIEKCAEAIKNPRWGVWLGRKSCPPASIIFRGTFDSREEARKGIEQLLEPAANNGRKRLRILREVNNLEESTKVLMDAPVDFSRRRFRSRMISDTIETTDADL
jgi:CRISPR system Cascade subunit CasD